MRYDVAIIGAGLSGLAAGIRLAHFERKVCIFEKHSRIGGLNSYYRKSGRHYDVGLHALTNYAPKTRGREAKSMPWPKMLRQLRIAADEIPLFPQRFSEIRFPGKTLRFTNEIDFLREEIAREFPAQIDAFDRLLARMAEFDQYSLEPVAITAREVLAEFLGPGLLAEMLLCPVMYYGAATEDDMPYSQFVIMFDSIFRQGFCRPREGIRVLLDVLAAKYRDAGGELRVRAGVRAIEAPQGRVAALTLDRGERVEAERVMSCAGYPETMALVARGMGTPALPAAADCVGANAVSVASGDAVGRMSFVESICALDAEPRDLGLEATIVFYCDAERFAYRRPAALVDCASGVVCCPNNFLFDRPLDERAIRLTNIANYELWRRLSREDYAAAKRQALDAALAAAARHIPDARARVVATDTITPLTIERFTSRLGGAVYGSPRKRLDGRTPIENLFICGADQGYLGVIGAMLSGITMANSHVLHRG